MSLTNAHEGYDYQDLLTAYFILDEVLKGNNKSIFAVDKKHTKGKYKLTIQDKDGNNKIVEKNVPDRFDDLVIINGNKIQRKQVKYSNQNVSRKLIKNDFANDSKGLALYEIYKSWNELNTPDSEFRLCLAWDTPDNEDIKNVLKPINTVPQSFPDYPTKLFKIDLNEIWEDGAEPLNSWNSFKKFVNDTSIKRIDFKKFCDELVIELELPKASLDFNSPYSLENILYKQAERLGIGYFPNEDVDVNRFLIILVKKISEYRTRSAEVSIDNILKDLQVKTDFGKIEQKFELDQTKNIKNTDKFSSLYDKIIENKKTLLIGEPGSGKSWFLTNFIDYLNDAIVKNVRHYCFTSTEDEFIEKRISSDVFFGNLISDIIKTFPKLKEVKEKLFVSDLDELNILLSHINEDLIIIIDGLDHIDRVLKNIKTLAPNKTRIIEYLSQINLPDNIFIVLGSQPVEEINPLINDFEYIEYDIPKWDIIDAAELMNIYSLGNNSLNEKLLSEYIFERSEGNVLYLTYIIKTLLEKGSSIDILEELPQYEFNLTPYYEYLINKIEDNLTSEILACLEFSVTKNELSELISPYSHHIEKNLKTLSPVITENISRGGIRLYHDSFRRFNLERLEKNANLYDIYINISKWLETLGFYKNPKAYRYLLTYYIKLKKFKKVKNFASIDFLTKSLYNGYPESIIKINYNNFLYVAKETLDLPLFTYISELNRTMYTTISEDYYSISLENFELYFKAVGLIFGFERANEILFFDGKANFCNEITANAFYISQRNDFTPNWNLLEDYFEKEIEIEKYAHYVSLLISQKYDLEGEFKELLNDDFKNFFKVFIIEIYYQIGFSKILDFYQEVEKEDKNKIAKRINITLNKTNCNQRIIIKNEKKHIVLEKLSLNFIDDYIKEDDLKHFYTLVRTYSIYNIEELKKFESSIPSSNFFFNWLKFFIRNFIIEDNLKNSVYKNASKLEDAIISNFRFLASDVNRYKGKPRVVDITYKNSALLNLTIEQGLNYIKSKKAWSSVILFLNEIPHNTLAILEKKYINKNNIKLIINTYEDLDKIDELEYSEHLEYSFKKAIYYAKSNKRKTAKKELKKASYLLTSYTHRKDRTLSEIIEPLDSIKKIDKKVAKKYVKQLKFLTDAVMKHTEDGKDTRWLTIEWFEKFLNIDYKLSSMYLIKQLLETPNFWKLDYMLIDYIQYSSDLDPIISNFLYKLSPKNIYDDYINSFADNVYNIIKIDRELAKQSLINILIRDLNGSSDKLKTITIEKLNSLKELLEVTLNIKENKEIKPPSYWQSDSLATRINKNLRIDNLSLTESTLIEINKYFDEKDDLEDIDLNNLYFYLTEKDDNELYKNILIPITQKKFPKDDLYFEQLRVLINSLETLNETKILLLVNTFIYSKDGWFSQFTNKQALKDAVVINKKETLIQLSNSLFDVFSNFGYGSKSTSNLIIACEYAGLKEDIILMYKNGFEFIENRLPSNNDFEWSSIKDFDLKEMNKNEMGIVVLLSKLCNFDSFIQKEITNAINYLFEYNQNLLIKPIKWFLKNMKYFPSISSANLLELFALQIENKVEFFKNIEDEMKVAKNFENLYIQNILDDLLTRIDNV